MKETLRGRIVADATAKEFESGKQVINFTIAIDKSYLKKGDTERTRKTVFVECAIWQSGKIPGMLKKGVLVDLFGDLGEPRAYENKQGELKAVNTFTVTKIDPLAWPARNHEGTARPVATAQAASVQAGDDLPF